MVTLSDPLGDIVSRNWGSEPWPSCGYLLAVWRLLRRGIGLDAFLALLPTANVNVISTRSNWRWRIIAEDSKPDTLTVGETIHNRSYKQCDTTHMQGLGFWTVDSKDEGAGRQRIFLTLQNWQAFLRGGFISIRELPACFRDSSVLAH